MAVLGRCAVATPHRSLLQSAGNCGKLCPQLEILLVIFAVFIATLGAIVSTVHRQTNIKDRRHKFLRITRQ